MPLTGVVDFGVTISAPIPCGASALIATDGTHHAIARLDNNLQAVVVACAETDTYPFTLSVAQWRADLLSHLGISGAGQFTPILCERIGVPGSPYFIVMGDNLDGGGQENKTFGIRYRIDSPGVVEIDGGYHYDTDNDGYMGGPGIWGGPLGQVKIGDYVYYNSAIFSQHLIKLPLVGDDVDLSADSWAAKRQNLPSPMDGILWWSARSTALVYNIAALYKDALGVGILVYDRSVTPQKVYRTVINTDGTNTGFNDVSASFGLPFSDANLLYDGSASGDTRDDYTSPSINALPDDELEIIFTRTFSDNKQFTRGQRFIQDAAGNISSEGAFEFQLTAAAMATEVEATWLYREGDELLAMMRDNTRYLFGYINPSVSRTGRNSDVNIEGL